MSCGLAMDSAVTVEEPAAAKGRLEDSFEPVSTVARESFPLPASERSQLGVSRESS
jgi:hypothetical protein